MPTSPEEGCDNFNLVFIMGPLRPEGAVRKIIQYAYKWARKCCFNVVAMWFAIWLLCGCRIIAMYLLCLRKLLLCLAQGVEMDGSR